MNLRRRMLALAGKTADGLTNSELTAAIRLSIILQRDTGCSDDDAARVFVNMF